MEHNIPQTDYQQLSETDLRALLDKLEGQSGRERDRFLCAEELARRGDHYGCGVSGRCCMLGEGVEKDEKKAQYYLTVAAVGGDPVFQHDLGLFYADPQSALSNPPLAVFWLERAAEQGYCPAMYKVGLCYDDGYGVPQNTEAALDWYRWAADGGNSDAQFILGLCYEYGDGVEQDLQKAVFWYQIATEAGDSDAAEAIQRLEKSAKA